MAAPLLDMYICDDSSRSIRLASFPNLLGPNPSRTLGLLHLAQIEILDPSKRKCPLLSVRWIPVLGQENLSCQRGAL
jgi:hypothetical protein